MMRTGHGRTAFAVGKLKVNNDDVRQRARRSITLRAMAKCSKRFSSARNSGEWQTRVQPERRVGCLTCSIS